MRDRLLGRRNKDGTRSYDAQAASALGNVVLERWEAFHSSQVGRRTPGDLTVCYLGGPEPQNDLEVLVSLGVHPNNIWAFESDNALYRAAVDAIRRSKFPSLKIQRGSIEQFFLSTPKRFDIVYLDACGPLPSVDQKTLRLVATVLRNHRLASPGALITNFALSSFDSHGKFVAGYLCPKDFLEYEHEDGSPGACEGAQAHGLYLEADDPKESFLSQVQGAFSDYYGQYITRQIMDMASVVGPWTRSLDAGYWKLFFNTDPKNIALAARAMLDMDSPDDELSGCAVSESGMYPLHAAIGGLELIGSQDQQVLGLMKAWIGQMTGLPAPSSNMDARTSIQCYDALRTTRRFDTPEFRRAMEVFDWRKQYQFCDLPSFTLAFDLVVNQLAYPMHYVTDAICRWRYTAKETEMFLDAVVLDECRYLYEWLPTIDLIDTAVADIQEQLTYRFALDALAKNRRWYNSEYFFGAAVIGQDEVGFEAKYLEPRRTLAMPGHAPAPQRRISHPRSKSG